MVSFVKNRHKTTLIAKRSDVDGAGFEPAASAMPTLRSYQTDLPALAYAYHNGKLLSIMLTLHV